MTDIAQNHEAMVKFDAFALGSDLPRSRKQYWLRRCARLLVSALRLNTSHPFSTELAQAILPVAKIKTPKGSMLCRAGHGRLVWRAETFYTEEPETIAWLNTMTPQDVLWDIGANVGLYSLYAAKVIGCRTFSFEPEAQNYATLVDNIDLNNLAALCRPVAVSLSDGFELGRLQVRYVTKGGAFNHFMGTDGKDEALPAAFATAQAYQERAGLQQVMFSCSADELIAKHGLDCPSFIKLDVDGLEPRIIKGAMATLADPRMKSVLVEINTISPEDMGIPDVLLGLGYEKVSERSNWESKAKSPRADEMPATNMIFSRPEVTSK
ncbi:MAG: FkbM family methyltransferase [Rhodospirillaceae bacterium]|jgi:FkbM family methyltransferase|nr:FkbM family methyltransferase [Rhodospirillaceae bacterium]MBT4687934.1 FkbM family methyltransferase [Rhodospirillaceae bacterium]MBT5079440.1 FkbM family methyltransferase [Rhodospirillaceae bacterium]MBT5878445.1 FkbM family methyltransferase [Rhodospirillaceae bacterium]MBT6590115.1 FkbM family methyltransferase [Rhodospirillaceae bacterium]